MYLVDKGDITTTMPAALLGEQSHQQAPPALPLACGKWLGEAAWDGNYAVWVVNNTTGSQAQQKW